MTDDERLWESRDRLLRAIARLSAKGYLPSHRELARALRWSESNVRYHMRKLEKSGRIIRRKGARRAFTVKP